MTELTRDQWQNLIDAMLDLDMIDHEDDARDDYSGRAMYGSTCIAFRSNGDLGGIMRFAYNLREALDSAELDDLDVEDFLSSARQDSMGLGTVLYFPSITVEKE
jgi:hypothetical protein